jgi:hypothetical protein
MQNEIPLNSLMAQEQRVLEELSSPLAKPGAREAWLDGSFGSPENRLSLEEFAKLPGPPLGTPWSRKSAADILSDIQDVLSRTFQGPITAPDAILIPRQYIFPCPIRFRVRTSKRSHSAAIERERARQLRGEPVRRSVFWRKADG